MNVFAGELNAGTPLRGLGTSTVQGNVPLQLLSNWNSTFFNQSNNSPNVNTQVSEITLPFGQVHVFINCHYLIDGPSFISAKLYLLVGLSHLNISSKLRETDMDMALNHSLSLLLKSTCGRQRYLTKRFRT